MKKGKDGFYNRYIKRILDFTISLIAIIVLSPLLLILAIVGAIAMKGNPFFVQTRPGKIDPKTGKERLYRLIKYRTMSNQKDALGNLLPDSERLNKYGRFLRKTSLDELPELVNIFIGDMSIVGPRPLLVKDMVFMSEEQRSRHEIMPGLTGLAQVNGRNALDWGKKFLYDIAYMQNISFLADLKIVFKTAVQVLFHIKGQKDSITDEIGLTDDFGDYLLKHNKINYNEYEKKQEEAETLLNGEMLKKT